MKRTYFFIKQPDDDLQKQGQKILDIIEAKSPVTREQLLAQIKLDVETRQTPKRLLAYHIGRLISTGCVEEKKHG